MRTLTAFDQDVEITVRSHRKRGEAGRITSFLQPDRAHGIGAPNSNRHFCQASW
jgi:hypothetical protein